MKQCSAIRTIFRVKEAIYFTLKMDSEAFVAHLQTTRRHNTVILI
jgi:hypothetical protein